MTCCPKPHLTFALVCAATRSQAKKPDDSKQKPVDAEEADKELDDIEYLPPKENKPKEKQTPSKDKPTVPNMSEGAAKAAENAKAENLFSDAATDIDKDDWTAEDVFLSKSYEKKIDMGSHKLRWDAFSIVVLVHCEEDKELVTAVPITDPVTQTIRSVRITKPKIPGILKNDKGEVVIHYLLGGNKKASASFGEAVYNDDNDVYKHIDVHFDKPIRRVISPINDVHLQLQSKNKIQCNYCGVKEVLECVNAIAFEVEEVAVRQTAAKKTRKTKVNCEISEY